MTTRRPSLAVVAVLLFGCEAHLATNARTAAASADDPTAIPIETARAYFAELGGLCAADNGKLWGRSLCGPFLFVDPGSREIVANARDANGVLKANGNVFVGTLPERETIANTAVDWSGTRWTMVMWDEGLAGDAARRRRMMLHEAFHRVQPALGLEAAGEPNIHLDERDGRYWLQLEWTALQAALTAGNDRDEAIADALTFRGARRTRYPLATPRENALEIHEGLAEYTGARLSGASSAEVVAAGSARRAKATGFVRSFAYVSGPLYGFLLDATGSDWHTRVKKDTDLGALLAERASVKPHQVAEAEGLADKYGGARLRTEEDAREAARQIQISKWRKSLVDGPVLIFDLTADMQGSFDPRKVFPLQEGQIVYTSRTLVAKWGKLTLEDAAILEDQQRARAFVSLDGSAADHRKGPGWSLQLDDAWTIEPSERAGDLHVVPRHGR